MSWSTGKHNEGMVCPALIIPNFVLLMVVAFAPLRREPARKADSHSTDPAARSRVAVTMRTTELQGESEEPMFAHVDSPVVRLALPSAR
jgi:hypothetical protein